MNNYTVTIKESSRELTTREKLKLLYSRETVNLYKFVEENGRTTLNPKGYIVLEIHNEFSKDKDYAAYLLETQEGVLYETGSSTFFDVYKNLVDVMVQEGEMYPIDVFTQDSKNYTGKSFLTCTVSL